MGGYAIELAAKDFCVALSGLGAVTPFGLGAERLFRGLENGEGAARPITRFTPKDWCQPRLAAEVPPFSLEELTGDAKEAGRSSPQLRLAWAATHLAMADAGLSPEDLPKERTGIFAGYGRFGTERLEEMLGKLLFGRLQEFLPIRIETIHPHGTTAHLGYLYKIVGPTMTFCSSCHSGIQALGAALTNLRDGEVDVAIVLGADLISNFQFHAEAAACILSSGFDPDNAPRPYDRNGDGLIMAEASVALILESHEYAAARRGRIRASLIGLRTVSEPHPFPPQCKRQLDIDSAIARIFHKIDPAEFDLIVADGRGLPYWDAAECRALGKVLVNLAAAMPVTSIQGNIGHAGGTSALLQTIGATLSMENSIIPPVKNLDTPAEGCNLNFVRGRSLAKEINRALVLAHSWGGDHSLILMQGA